MVEMGAAINSRMGLNSWAAFVGTDANAAIAGDVAMLPGEVTAVLKALRQNGLEVVAIHHHMLDTQPGVIFVHYWGTGPADKLATGFKAALDQLAQAQGVAVAPLKGRQPANRDISSTIGARCAASSRSVRTSDSSTRCRRASPATTWSSPEATSRPCSASAISPSTSSSPTPRRRSPRTWRSPPSSGVVRPGVKVIVLAPATTHEDVVAALRAQVFACFTPPFDFREVAAMGLSALEAVDWRHGIEVVSGLPYWMTLRVSCDLLTAERLVRFMTEREDALPEKDRDLLMTAFREMLVNAMEHGAGFDPGKVIEVTAARTERAIVYHFRDPGNGFDRADLAHAARTRQPEELIDVTLEREKTGRRPGGFGMLLVKQIADELVYNERGNEVLLIKHLK